LKEVFPNFDESRHLGVLFVYSGPLLVLLGSCPLIPSELPSIVALADQDVDGSIHAFPVFLQIVAFSISLVCVLKHTPKKHFNY
jgi:hypothetical protein